MKKSLIALAVAGAMTAPIVAQADATLYGSMRIKAVDSDAAGATLNVQDNSTRFGIRGSQETGMDGVTAAFRFEWANNTQNTGANVTNRLGYLSLNTNIGNFNFGRQWTPAFLMVAAQVDILDHSSNPTHDYSAGVEGRQSQALSYVSPDMGGLRVALVGAFNNGGANESGAGKKDTVDWTNIAAKYSMAGFEIAASQTSNENTGNDVTSFAASYTMDALYIAGYYADNENSAATADETFEIAGSYDLGTVKLLANYVDFDKEGNQVAVEAWYKLGKKARVFANYTDQDSDSEAAGRADSWAVGYRVDF